MTGVLIVDKPEGMTSHDVVAIARRALGERRIGHTGTLDPLATGVLPLACGKATRLVRFLSASDKEYEASIRFGLTTDTYDITGTETGRVPGEVRRQDMDAALTRFTGDYLQTPPPYSAKKVEGIRAYALARQEQPVALKPVPVRVTSCVVLDFDGTRARVRLTCSAGFYVRTFAHDVGRAAGAGACLEALRRTRSGEFSLQGAVSIEELQTDPEAALAWLTPPENLLTSYPAVTVSDEGRLRVSHGRQLGPGHYSGHTGAWTRILDADGALLALGRPEGTPGTLHPEVVLI